MTIFHLLLVAIIQGVTEFLPVSSSGHLILLPLLTGMQDQGQVIDVAVHLGTLGAVMVYFWSDLRGAIVGLGRLIIGRIDTPGARLALLLIIATLPAVVFGLALKLSGLDDRMRSIEVIGWTTLGFGILLHWADQRGPGAGGGKRGWGMRDAVVMGMWQALALIPGTSRSGITITAARVLGYTRHDAARLSMLMSVPVILASAGLVGAEAAATADMAALRQGAIAAAFSFVSALAAIFFMMRLLQRISFTPYVIYRVALGLFLLSVAYG